MNLALVIAIELLAQIMCIEIKGIHYTVFKNKQGVSENSTKLHIGSIIQCAAQCSETPGCMQANFVKNNKQCELLQLRQGIEINVVEDMKSKLIRTNHYLLKQINIIYYKHFDKRNQIYINGLLVCIDTITFVKQHFLKIYSTIWIRKKVHNPWLL